MNKFVYPCEPPLEGKFNWFNYMLQCRSDKCFGLDRKFLFDNYYKGRIVEWEGICRMVYKRVATFFMNPTEYKLYNLRSDIFLKYTPEVLSTFPSVFVRKEFCKFRAEIVKTDFIQNHELIAVPMKGSEVDYDISWIQFTFLFGARSINAPNLLFRKFWKGYFYVDFSLFYFRCINNFMWLLFKF
jgi:hypothetical protein